MTDIVERLRDAFKRARYGSTGEYNPDLDLLDAAADEIERLRDNLLQISWAASCAVNVKPEIKGASIAGRINAALQPKSEQGEVT